MKCPLHPDMMPIENSAGGDVAVLVFCGVPTELAVVVAITVTIHRYTPREASAGPRYWIANDFEDATTPESQIAPSAVVCPTKIR